MLVHACPAVQLYLLGCAISRLFVHSFVLVCLHAHAPSRSSCRLFVPTWLCRSPPVRLYPLGCAVFHLCVRSFFHPFLSACRARLRSSCRLFVPTRLCRFPPVCVFVPARSCLF